MAGTGRLRHSARMASWFASAMHVVAFGAWGLSGLVALLLAPRDRAARRLALAGALLVATRLLDHLLVDDPVVSAAWRGEWSPRLLSQLVFLGALAAVVATLAVFPDGGYDRRWHRGVVVALATATGVFGALRLIASPVIRTPTDGDGGAPNPHASTALGALDRLADVIFATEPGWIVLGVVLLLARYRRGDRSRRAALRRPLAALAVLAVLLVVIVVAAATGLDVLGDGPLPEAAFLLALALFPLALLASVVAGVRTLESRLVASRTRLVEAEDAARRRIERDLHDGVQQQLAAIGSLVQLATRQVARDPAVAATTLAEIAEGTEDAARELRQVVAGIHPAVLTDRGLVHAVEARLQRIPLASRLTADAASRTTRWSPAAEGAAYFAACEAITNVLKHADATVLDVRIEGDREQILVEVRDDGRGFDPATVGERGLLGVRDRVESLGGAAEVTSRPGHGTTVAIRLPGVCP